MVAGKPSLPRAGWGDPGNLGSTSFAAHNANGHPVAPAERAVTLAGLRAEHGDFDLIKLDVEGMEQEILEGDREYLARGGTTLWVECNENSKSLALAEMLLSWGLKIYYFAFPSHNPDNFRGETHPIFPWAYEAGLLVAPNCQPVLDTDLTAHLCILRPIRAVQDLLDAMWRTPRWLPADLAHADTAELAAVAGRALRGQARDAFLVAETGVTVSAPNMTIWDRLAAAEAGLSEAQALAFERQDQLRQERERREAAEAGLSEARTLAFERQDQLRQEREQREAAEAALSEARAVAFERQDQLERERERREAADLRLATTAALALARLGDLGAERERTQLATNNLEAVEARLHAAERQAEARLRAAERQAEARLQAAEQQADAVRRQRDDAEAQLAAIRTTVVWRIARPINAFIGTRPRLHTALRRMRGVVGTLLGRRG